MAIFITIPLAIGTTGQGTELGLSLSYELIKSYKVFLTLESELGKGCMFKIILRFDGKNL